MNRILLKLSGEAFGASGFDYQQAEFLANEIAMAHNTGVQLGIVIGGGNIWRKKDSQEFGFRGADSDAIGMGATIMNAAVLHRMLAKYGINSSVLAPLEFGLLAKLYTPDVAKKSFESGRICIFGGGTGSPFFTTDTAAVLRALEIEAGAVFKGTKVNGVYNDDPKKNPNAKKYDDVSFDEAIDKDLKIMDATAFALAKENGLPILVFDAFQKGSIVAALEGKHNGTWVK